MPRLLQFFCLSFFMAAAGAAAAQSASGYPNKPVRIITPFAAGGTTDVLARPIAADFAKNFGQGFVVDDRPGGDGIIGTGAVAKAAPDGYTLLITSDSIYVTPGMYKDMPYDTLKDFSVIAGLARNEIYLAIHPSVPANNVNELVAYAKANPGKLNIGVGSPTTYVRDMTFMEATGTKLTPVNYKGGAPAVVDLLTGTIQVVIFSPALVETHIKSGKLKGLAITGDRRNPAFPDIPTFAEAGLKFDLAGSLQFPFLAPAKTPADIVEKLNVQTRKTLADPEVAAVLGKLGFAIAYVGTAQAAKSFALELEHYTKLLKALPPQ